MKACGHTLKVFGLNHHSAPVEVRERVALAPTQLQPLYRILRDQGGVHEAMILNTCNRLEFVIVTCLDDGTDRVVKALQPFSRGGESDWEQWSFCYEGEEAIRHIFEVAAGLDSQMVGETEIFGQIKKAYAQAIDTGAAGPWVHRLCQRAFQAGKWARTHTGIQKGRVTEAGVALELAQRMFGELADCRLLVVGTGEVARRTLQEFHTRLREPVMIAGRDLEKSAALAHEFGGGHMLWSDALAKLEIFDVVLFSTSAPGYLLTEADLRSALGRGRNRPLFLMDLAMPRDVDPAAADLSDVYLYGLDDLARIANENLELRRQEIDSCRTQLHKLASDCWQEGVSAIKPQCVRGEGLLACPVPG